MTFPAIKNQFKEFKSYFDIFSIWFSILFLSFISNLYTGKENMF